MIPLRKLWVEKRSPAGVRCALLGVLLASIVGVGLFAPTPYDPRMPGAGPTSAPPSLVHWFGTDVNGFDVFSRTVAAAGVELPLALLGVGLSFVIGIPLGLLVSVKRPWAEGLMRLVDAFQALPLVVVALAIVALLGDALASVILAIVVINVPRFMRVMRSESLAVRELRFMMAAVAAGASKTRIAVLHLLPNVIGVAFVHLSLAAGHALIVIAALSFLGVGVTPPDPSWGQLLRSGGQRLGAGEWWVVVFPGTAVIATVAVFNSLSSTLSKLLHERGA